MKEKKRENLRHDLRPNMIEAIAAMVNVDIITPEEARAMMFEDIGEKREKTNGLGGTMDQEEEPGIPFSFGSL